MPVEREILRGGQVVVVVPVVRAVVMAPGPAVMDVLAVVGVRMAIAQWGAGPGDQDHGRQEPPQQVPPPSSVHREDRPRRTPSKVHNRSKLSGR
jgi:hypothetical protein